MCSKFDYNFFIFVLIIVIILLLYMESVVKLVLQCMVSLIHESLNLINFVNDPPYWCDIVYPCLASPKVVSGARPSLS